MTPFASTQLVPFITGIESRGYKPQINTIPNNPFLPAFIHSTSAKLTKYTRSGFLNLLFLFLSFFYYLPPAIPCDTIARERSAMYLFNTTLNHILIFY